MKTTINMLIIAGLAMAFMSCENRNTNIIPSDNITSQFADIKGFSGLEVSATFQAEVRFSDDEQPIEIIANENLHPYILVEKESDLLKVSLKNNVNISGPAQLKVILTTGQISSFIAKGASEISLADTLNADMVDIKLSGASKMEGPLSVQTLTADLHDASFLGLGGRAVDYRLVASGASKAFDYSLSCRNLDANLSGASEVKLTILEKIDISASSASILNYKGTAVINSQSLTGASKVIKTD